MLDSYRVSRDVTCAECGRGFVTRSESAKFCSNRCRQAAKYQRMKAQRLDAAKSSG